MYSQPATASTMAGPPIHISVRVHFRFGAGLATAASCAWSLFLRHDVPFSSFAAASSAARFSFNCVERTHQCVEIRARNAAQRVVAQLARDHFHLVDDRVRLGRQIQPPATAIARIGAALDEAGLFQAVDHAADRNRLHVQVFGELGLAQAFVPPGRLQRAPLRARKLKARGAAIEMLADLPRRIVQQVEERVVG